MPATFFIIALVKGKSLVYTVENSVPAGRWTTWNNSTSPNVNGARKET
jgi:hypothetical protein